MTTVLRNVGHRTHVLGVALVALAGCGAQPPTAPPGADTLSASAAPSAAVTTLAANTPESPSTPRPSLRSFTGGRTRAVWIRDLGDGTDILGFGDAVVVMGFDSEGDQGERPLVETPGSYAKPQFTPRGDRVVYNDRRDDSVRVVAWDGGPSARLTDGFPLATWSDPQTGVEWVYVGNDPRGTEPESYGAIHRLQIDDPTRRELVWNKRAVSGDSFQLSRDGRLAGALARWPDAGVLELPNGEWRPLGEGCWTSLAGDDSGLFWYFDGQHRNITMVDTGSGAAPGEEPRWTVTINTAPGIDGFEVWHPRWSNHPRFFTMSGPYAVGGGDNKIRGGGEGVEIYIGRFAPDHRRIEGWRQVTDNDAADFYPDVWVEPGGDVPVLTEAPDATGSTTPAPVAATASHLVVEVRVARASPVPTPRDIAPYRHALQVLEYDVITVVEGEYDDQTLLAAHWVIRDAETLDTATRPPGTTYQLTLEPYAAHPELEGERLVMESDRFDLPLFFDLDSGS
ncbi:MAG: hypothetical protein O3A25_09205 [Acidobacteria bacterium]|nr:hypothetical protein [Acidobacteriota bacterium]